VSLSNKSIIDDFRQISTLYNDPKNLGCAFTKKHKDITLKEICSIMRAEIRKMIKSIEEKFGFTLENDMKEFDEFLRTGVAKRIRRSDENIEINSNKPIKITNCSDELLGRVRAVIQNNIGENFLLKGNHLDDNYKNSINKKFYSACVIDISGFSEEKQIHKEISNFNAALMIDGKIYLPYLRFSGSLITKFRDHLTLKDEDIVESFGVENIYTDFGISVRQSKNFPKPLKMLEMLCPNSLGGLMNEQIEQNDTKQAEDQSLVVNPNYPSLSQQINDNAITQENSNSDSSLSQEEENHNSHSSDHPKNEKGSDKPNSEFTFTSFTELLKKIINFLSYGLLCNEKSRN